MCRSWRFRLTAGHDGHDSPGSCRDCWTPCFQRIARDEWKAGVRRCAECERSLIQCPMVSVRRALVTDPFVTESVLAALRSDPNGPVSMAADRALLARENAHRKSRSSDVVTLNLSPRGVKRGV